MKRILFFVTALAALSAGSMSAQTQTAQTQKENVMTRVQALCETGDFDRVSALLDQISRESPELAADALVERAKCSVVRGQEAARSSYESVIRNYAADPAAVADARSGIFNLPVPSGRPAIYTVDIDAKTGLVRGPVAPIGQTPGVIQQFPTWSPDDQSIAYHAGPMGQGAVIVRSLASGVEKTYDARRTDRGGPSLWLNTGEGLLWIASGRNFTDATVAGNRPPSPFPPPGMTQAFGITQADTLVESATTAGARGNPSAKGFLDALEAEGSKTNRTPLSVASQKTQVEVRDLQQRTNARGGAIPGPAPGKPGDVYRIDVEPPQILMNLNLAGTAPDGFFTVSPRDHRLYSMSAITSGGVAVVSLHVYDLSTGKEISSSPFPLRTDALPVTHGFPAGGQIIAISPDGERLAFTLRPTEKDASIQICSTKGDGKDCKILLPNAGPVLGVAWAADGRSIFYAKSLFGVGAAVETNRIMRVSVDGGSPTYTGLEVRGMTYFDLNHAGTRLAFDGVSYSVAKGGSQ